MQLFPPQATDPTEQNPMNPNPLLSALGYDASARLVIFHADDVGMCHGSNRAFVECQAVGMLKTGSVMMPCPWAAEMVQTAAANPSIDLGVPGDIPGNAGQIY